MGLIKAIVVSTLIYMIFLLSIYQYYSVGIILGGENAFRYIGF